MAKPKTADDTRVIQLVEVMVSLQSRGRSVINGTMLIGSEVRVFAHELSDEEKSSLRELIASTLAHRYTV